MKALQKALSTFKQTIKVWMTRRFGDNHMKIKRSDAVS